MDSPSPAQTSHLDSTPNHIQDDLVDVGLPMLPAPASLVTSVTWTCPPTMPSDRSASPGAQPDRPTSTTLSAWAALMTSLMLHPNAVAIADNDCSDGLARLFSS